MPISNRCGVKFGRCGFIFKAILARRKCARKDKKAHKKAHKESGLRSKRKRPTPEQNRKGGSRQRALLKENSQTTPELASANAQQIAALQAEILLLTAELEGYNDLYAATLSRCDEHDARLQALTAERDEKDARLQALTAERDEKDARLQALTVERDEHEARMQALTVERDEHEARMRALTAERDEHEARVQALTEKNVDLSTQNASKDEMISDLTEDFENSKTLLKISEGKLNDMRAKFTNSGWEHLNLEGLYKLYKELEQLTLSLELETRQKVAENRFARHNQDCVCPISMELATNAVQLPCKCKCVFQQEVLEKLIPSDKCPTCRAKFSPELVQPNHVLRNLIEREVKKFKEMDWQENVNFDDLVQREMDAVAQHERSYTPGTPQTPQSPRNPDEHF